MRAETLQPDTIRARLARAVCHPRYTLVFIAAVLLALSGCTMTNMFPVVVQEEASGLVGEIHGPMTVGQTFLASRNNLARIDLPIATYGRRNNHAIIFHLSAISDQPDDLVTMTLQPDEINPNGYTRIHFPPIPYSAGKSFYFYLDSPDSIPGDAMSVYYNAADVYKDGQGCINGQPIVGDLAFRAYTREVFTLTDVWHDFISRASGDVPFFVFYGTLLAAVLAGLIAITLQGKTGHK